MINIKNLSLSYNNKELLKNINFSLKQGESVAIMGESGSGKSLFARALIRLFHKNFKLSAKEFLINNEDILSLKNLQNHRKKVALIMQETQLVLPPSLDIGQFFHIVLKTHTSLNAAKRRELAFETLVNLGFDDIDRLWHSYAHTLSVGMIRRVNLALTLVCKPEILILDEITSSLDKQNAQNITEILTKLKENLSLIIITHDLNLAKICDKIILFENGSNTLDLSTKEFFDSNLELVRAYKEIYA